MAPAAENGKLNFAGMPTAKRRRTRSDENASSTGNDDAQQRTVDDDEEKTVQTSKCKGATTIPIFLKSKFDKSLFPFAMLMAISLLRP